MGMFNSILFSEVRSELLYGDRRNGNKNKNKQVTEEIQKPKPDMKNILSQKEVDHLMRFDQTVLANNEYFLMCWSCSHFITCSNDKEALIILRKVHLLNNPDHHIQIGNSSSVKTTLATNTDGNLTRSDIPKSYTLELDNIIGYQEVKDTLRHIVNISEDNKKIHMLIAGAPGTAKTVFLKSMQKELDLQGCKTKYVNCGRLTKSGLFDVLFELDRVEVLLIDEIDKLEVDHQTGLLDMAETGLIQEITARKNREKDLGHMTVICTGNYLNQIIEPLRTRFITQYIPAYTEDQYLEICELMLMAKYGESKPKGFLTKPLAKHVAIESYKHIKPINMRDADRVARLIRKNPTIEEIDKQIKNITKYAIPEHVLKELDEQK